MFADNRTKITEQNTPQTSTVAEVTHAVQRTGAAVVNGVLSTLIAALCLAGSGTYVFITFFFALLFIVLCGAFSGLVVLPVLLDIFQPAPHSSIEREINAGAASDGADPGQQDPPEVQAGTFSARNHLLDGSTG